jgi:molybdopterin-guanine dinucleotide biosynthesis protein
LQLGDLIGARQVITVSGAHKGVGKTALSEILLRNLHNFTAIKITITDDDVMVTDDEQVIMSPSTDTCRMKRSGAVKVVWVRSTEDGLFDSLKSAFEKIIPSSRGILVEGNSILRHLHPTLAFFVAQPPFDAMKPSRVHALKKADVCVINQFRGTVSSPELSQRVHAFNPHVMFLSLNLLDPAASDGNDYNRLLTLLSERIA